MKANYSPLRPFNELGFFKIVPLIIIFLLTSFIEAKAKNNFLPQEQYSKLSKNQKISYMNDVRRVLVDLEQKLSISKSFALNTPPYSNEFQMLSWVLPHSTAQEVQLKQNQGAWKGKKCIAGGVLLDVVNGFCTVSKNKCNTRKNELGFQCGEIFSKVCVPMNPKSSISARCQTNSNQLFLTEEDYKKNTAQLQSDIDKVCKEQDGSKSNVLGPCTIFWEKISTTNKKYNQTELKAPQWKNKSSGRETKLMINEKETPQQKCPPFSTDLTLGASHAMCLSCVYDKAVSDSSHTQGFVSSRKWITYISLAQQLCLDSKRSLSDLNDKKLNAFDSVETLNILSKVGACSEKTYTSQSLTGQSKDDWAEKFSNVQSGTTIQNWQTTFGVNPDQTKKIFCPDDRTNGFQNEGYVSRLRLAVGNGSDFTGVSDEFKKCLDEIIKKENFLSKMNSCKGIGTAVGTIVAGTKKLDLIATLKDRKVSPPFAIIVESSGKSECVTFINEKPPDKLEVISNQQGLLPQQMFSLNDPSISINRTLSYSCSESQQDNMSDGSNHATHLDTSPATK